MALFRSLGASLKWLAIFALLFRSIEWMLSKVREPSPISIKLPGVDITFSEYWDKYSSHTIVMFVLLLLGNLLVWFSKEGMRRTGGREM